MLSVVIGDFLITATVNNAGKPPNTVDLHGLFVEEAKEKAEVALHGALERQNTQIRFIVGKVSGITDIW